jgi:hypothetical protein
MELPEIEQVDIVIPPCQFDNPLPNGIQNPSIPEMKKFFTIMKGCPKWKVNEDWAKKMLNWDLFTHPQTIEFNQSTSCEKKLEMSASWQTYMKDNKCWLSFYEWLTQTKNEDVQMMESDSSSVRHKWKGLDGKKLESPSIFPPFKGIIL